MRWSRSSRAPRTSTISPAAFLITTEVTFTANPGGVANTPPTSGGLYFCHAKIDGRSKAMTVSHRNVFGSVLSEITLEPEAA